MRGMPRKDTGPPATVFQLSLVGDTHTIIIGAQEYLAGDGPLLVVPLILFSCKAHDALCKRPPEKLGEFLALDDSGIFWEVGVIWIHCGWGLPLYAITSINFIRRLPCALKFRG